MAFTAVLRLDAESKSWPAREFHWAIVQEIGEYARPEAGIHAGQVHVVLDHLHDPVLDDWMAEATKRRAGSLEISGLDGSRFRTLTFRDAYCVSEGLCFNSTGIGPATTMSVLISADHLLIDGEVELDNHWPL